MRHRSLLAVLAGVLAVSGVAGAPAQASDADLAGTSGHIDGPPTVTGADLVFTNPSRTLRDGSPEGVRQVLR